MIPSLEMAVREGRLSETDARRLSRAIELGRRGWGRVHPNPMVGAVVARDGEVLGEGYHEVLGGAHAEVAALSAAGNARGATLYTSLEPCRHRGRTPPCTEALRAAGVARVVFWAADPGAEAGGGGEWLRNRGLGVDGPFGRCEDWRAENPFFFHAPARPRPYLALKLAVSLDGRIAPAGGRRVWLTGPESRREVHRLRAGFDAIMVGRGTWEADDPRLTARGPVTPRVPPVPVLLDRRGRAGPELRVLGAEADARGVLVTVGERAAELRRRIGDRADIVAVPTTPHGFDLAALLAELHGRGLTRVLCEGGGRVAASLLAARLVDRIYLFIAPVLVGSAGVPAFPVGATDGGPEPAAAHAAPHRNPVRAGGSPSPARGWQTRIDPVRFGDDTHIVLDRST
ncbi:MAG: bifunctional diaminohydroxyphosphoribosylaminopyrimidine deaminase/5-amino-6-(5-phosphoribosylamino)uracil reductase RibD [Gemmatimonadota bacterium]|nr:bifunctional diaminohydroxyphosphoribosylaminopyrimidine deaminase/5-amino-6-(5-phosphoribosylamino)uracil reductase RibD [Gemmatimonadota bacterium]